MPERNLGPFQDLVRRRCGFTAENLQLCNLASAVATRMEATKTELSSAYFTNILANEDEFSELVALLTINETYFFREPAQLRLLADRLVPRLLAQRGDRLPLRILSAGCSSGEEPYSIAITLKEKFGESVGRLVSIIAGDIDRQALERARLATYHEYSFRITPPEIRERYFASSGGHSYVLGAGVRSLVEFHPLNVLSPPLSDPFTGFDIVFFRNVSLYFDREARKNIQTALHAAMNESAYLILGTTETLSNDLGVFRPTEECGHFYFTKGIGEIVPNPVPSKTVLSSSPPARASKATPARRVAPKVKEKIPPLASPPPSGSESAIEAVRTLVREKKYQEALEKAASGRAAVPAAIDFLLLEGYVRLQMRQFSEAAAIASQALEIEPWSAEAHMLLAFTAKSQDDPENAIHWFKLTAYSKPDCWPAHYFLGNLLQPLDGNRARREYRTALQQLASNPDPDGGLRLPLDLPVADIRFLCERRSASTASQNSGAAERPTG